MSFSLECETQAHILSENMMGIDLGIKETAVVAFGNEKYVFHNINHSKQIRLINKRILLCQRSMSRKYAYYMKHNKKYEQSNNMKRLVEQYHKLLTRKANIINNYYHQITHYLVSLLPKQVVMETLIVSDIAKNKYISSQIYEQNLNDFIMKMKYKCYNNNIPFVLADRYYPSSKTCSSCGVIKKHLKLSERTYVCDSCGLVIDRDYNAAINLMRYKV